MKIQQTLPENEEFFSRYAALIPVLYKTGYLAQIVQAVTEITIVYAVIYSRAVEFTPENAGWIAGAGAVLLPLVLAVGLRTFLTYSIRAILGRHFSGLDRWMSGLIFAIAAALLISSGALSFHGAKDMIEIASPPPAQKGTDEADSRRSKEENRTLDKFSRDSALVASNFNAKIQALRSRYKAEIKETQIAASRSKLAGERSSHWRRSESLKAERDATLASLEAAKTDSLSALFAARERRLSSVLEGYEKEAGKIEAANTEALSNFRSRTNKYGGLLAYFTLLCLAFTALTIALYEIHRKGSGIKPVALPNQYHFSQGVFEEFNNALSDKFQYHARSLIRRLEESTPAPPLPAPPPTLYDFDKMSPRRLKVGSAPEASVNLTLKASKLPGERSGASSPTLSTPNPVEAVKTDLEPAITAYLETALQLAEANLVEAAKSQELKAEDVIRAYLGEVATEEEVQRLKEEVVAYIQGRGPNPFNASRRATVIGFRRPTAPDEEPDVNAMRRTQTVNRAGGVVVLDCQRCGKPFERRTTFQKFCSEDCRVKSWEERTGRPLKKGK